MMTRKTLNLTLKKEWFDLIKSGQKVFEYREYKQHWMSRLLCHSGTRTFDAVKFTNGYGAHRPTIECEFIGMGIMPGKHIKPDNNEPIDNDKDYFVIALGNIIDLTVED